MATASVAIVRMEIDDMAIPLQAAAHQRGR